MEDAESRSEQTKLSHQRVGKIEMNRIWHQQPSHRHHCPKAFQKLAQAVLVAVEDTKYIDAIKRNHLGCFLVKALTTLAILARAAAEVKL